jgi:hypothetical protein
MTLAYGTAVRILRLYHWNPPVCTLVNRKKIKMYQHQIRTIDYVFHVPR